jgi:hypothetical protein
MSELEASVRDTIALYVEGYITVADLNGRLPDGWDLDEAADPATTDLVMLVIGYLSEFHDGDISEDLLRRALARRARWWVERTVVSFTEDLKLQVRAAADTELQEVSAS